MGTRDLHAIKRALQRRLANDTLFSFMNTRIILRTGVDLTKVHEPVENATGAEKVLTILEEMGYDLEDDVR